MEKCVTVARLYFLPPHTSSLAHETTFTATILLLPYSLFNANDMTQPSRYYVSTFSVLTLGF